MCVGQQEAQMLSLSCAQLKKYGAKKKKKRATRKSNLSRPASSHGVSGAGYAS